MISEFINESNSILNNAHCQITREKALGLQPYPLMNPKPRKVSAFVSSGLPDEKGRLQILHIHTARMRGHQLLSADVDIKELAVETKNFSGAELEGLVRAAQSTAMNRHIKVRKLSERWSLWSECLPPFFLSLPHRPRSGNSVSGQGLWSTSAHHPFSLYHAGQEE